MRLGARGRYAVMAMCDLARHQAAARGRAVALAEIAGRQEISLAYLEQLFAQLRRAGLVLSARGPGGGYRLARPSSAIAVAEVVGAVEEPVHATRCEGQRGCLSAGARCETHDLWDALGRNITAFLAAVSLADVVEGRIAQPAGEAKAA